MDKISKAGEYLTRDGQRAVVLCTDAPGLCPVVGYLVSSVDCGGDALTVIHPRSWCGNGMAYFTTPHGDDICEAA